MTTTQTHQEWYAAETARWAAIEGARSRLLAALMWRTIPAAIVRAAARTDLTPDERAALRSLRLTREGYVFGSSLTRDDLHHMAQRFTATWTSRPQNHPYARLHTLLGMLVPRGPRDERTAHELAVAVWRDAEAIARGELVLTAGDGRTAWTLAEQAVVA